MKEDEEDKGNEAFGSCVWHHSNFRPPAVGCGAAALT